MVTDSFNMATFRHHSSRVLFRLPRVLFRPHQLLHLSFQMQLLLPLLETLLQRFPLIYGYSSS